MRFSVSSSSSSEPSSSHGGTELNQANGADAWGEPVGWELDLEVAGESKSSVFWHTHRFNAVYYFQQYKRPGKESHSPYDEDQLCNDPDCPFWIGEKKLEGWGAYDDTIRVIGSEVPVAKFRRPTS